jgi:ribosomal 50S subunit-recycling heat shock protein
VFNKYKQIKRDIAKREQQKRLNWFMSIVKCKAWATKMVKIARRRIQEKRIKEQNDVKKQNTLKLEQPEKKRERKGSSHSRGKKSSNS